MSKKKINYGFEPSEYQKEIFDFIQHGQGNAVIKATAGSGKTTTIVTAMKLIPKKEKCLFIAFNKAIVESLNEKLTNCQNVTVRTAHSLGLAMLKRNIEGEIVIDEYKYRTYLKKNLSELTSIQEGTRMTESDIIQYVESISSLIDYSRLNLAQTVKEIENVALKYDIPINYDECDVALKCLNWGKENNLTIDYTDMVWLPVELSIRPIGLQFDWVFVDEAQDMSMCTIKLFLKCFKRGTRFVAVGDSQQCQPKGTLILMSDGSEKPIEEIVRGDGLVTYDSHSKCAFRGYKPRIKGKCCKVEAVEHHHVSSKLVTVTCENGTVTQYTPEHICYAKFNSEECDRKYMTYLIQVDDRYSIGYCKFFSGDSFNLLSRMNTENAQRGWILDIYGTENEARHDASLCMLSYGIPLVSMNPFPNSNDWFTNTDRAVALLYHFNRRYEYPFHMGEMRHGRGYITEYNACNLIKDVMDVVCFDSNNMTIRQRESGGSTERLYKPVFTKISNIEYNICDTEVYSLAVEKDRNYVADGILTHNCIFAFAGANERAFQYMCNYPNTKLFTLPISYRCDRNIVKAANTLVPDMKSRDDADDGIILQECSYNRLKDGDMVLARTRTPLLKLYTKLLQKNVKCYIKGQDIGQNLIDLLNTTDLTELNSNLQKDGVFVRLYDNMLTARNNLMKRRGLDYNDATLSMNVMNIYDSINALITLSFGMKDKEELIDRIRKIFADEQDGICLSTIHKAKGLEADNVYILCRSSMPSGLAKKDWEKEQEQNLVYVALTRAKHVLGYISEKEIKPSASLMDPDSIIDEVRYIDRQVCDILGKPTAVDIPNDEISRFRLKSATDVDNIDRLENEIEITDNKVEISNKIDIANELSRYLSNGGDIEKLKKFLTA